MMRWWSLFGLTRMLTERRQFTSPVEVKPLGQAFRRSLFVYPVDIGNSNALNLNVDRFGIFFADTPRHADLFLLLGDLIPALRESLENALRQAPRPFGALWIREGRMSSARDSSDIRETDVESLVSKAGGTLIGQIESLSGPGDIIGALRASMTGSLK